MARQAEADYQEWAEYAVKYVLHGYTFVTEPTRDEAEAQRWCAALDGKLLRLKAAETTYTWPEQGRPASS
jgi:hypothetical protein